MSLHVLCVCVYMFGKYGWSELYVLCVILYMVRVCVYDVSVCMNVCVCLVQGYTPSCLSPAYLWGSAQLSLCSNIALHPLHLLCPVGTARLSFLLRSIGFGLFSAGTLPSASTSGIPGKAVFLLSCLSPSYSPRQSCRPSGQAQRHAHDLDGQSPVLVQGLCPVGFLTCLWSVAALLAQVSIWGTSG